MVVVAKFVFINFTFIKAKNKQQLTKVVEEKVHNGK